MSVRKSAIRFGLCSCLVLSWGCRHGHPRRDAATDPSTESDAAVCDFDAGATPVCTGTVDLQTRVNFCPRLALAVTPTQTLMDQGVQVSSGAVDPENDPITFEWTAEPDGRFDDPSAGATIYRCDSMGRKTLTLVANDGPDCDVDDTVEVSCVDVDGFLRSGARVLPSMP